MLEKGTGKGNDFLGWLHLPSSISKEHLADLNATAKVLRDNCEAVSYTHLDVYKRQSHSFTHSILYSLVMTAVWLSVVVKRVLS